MGQSLKKCASRKAGFHFNHFYSCVLKFSVSVPEAPETFLIVLKAKNYINLLVKFLAIATGKIQTQDSYQTTCDFSYETLTILKFLDN